MKIKSILNNSALIALNDKNKELVLIGKGISFNKHPGDDVDTSKIEKQFGNDSKTASDLSELLEEIPEKYFDMTCAIVRYANKKLKDSLNKNIYVSLSDHINSAIARYNENIELNFGLIAETKVLYPMEYEISEWALDYINATLDIELPEEECGFIVLHIINASAQMDNTSHAKRVIKMTKDLCTIVDEYYSGEYERDGLDYSRFLTHLKYFSIRYLNRNQIEEKDTIKITFSDEAVSKTKECMKKINDYLNSKYGTLLNEHEQQYLMLHFCRLLGIN